LKKIINFLIFLQVIIFFNSLNAVENSYKNSEIELKQLSEIPKENLKQFHKAVVELCGSKKNFENIVKHKSYPNFGTEKNWEKVCSNLTNKKKKEDYIRYFIINNFKSKLLNQKWGLLTGYYEPTIKVSWKKTTKYKYPILMKQKKFAGKTRKIIKKIYKKEDVLLWTDDKIDFFFLQIQGSGIGIFENNKKIKLSYSGNNGIKYSSIGKYLVKKNLIDNNISMFTIKKWLRQNSNKIESVLNKNGRYIFFSLKKDSKPSAIGAIGKNLIPQISIAIDEKIYPLGIPFLIKTKNNSATSLVISHDTGSAIIGPNRADLYTGRNKKAENIAGKLKKKIHLLALIPKKNE